MNRKKWKGKLIRALVIAALVLLIVGAIYLILTNYLPDLIPVLRRGSQAEIEAYIKRTTGFRGVVLVALLQCLQVLSIVFPGAPIQIAAGIVYGAPVGVAICLISFVTVNFAIFTSTVWCGSTCRSPSQRSVRSNTPCRAKPSSIWSKKPTPVRQSHVPRPSRHRLSVISVSLVCRRTSAVLVCMVCTSVIHS